MTEPSREFWFHPLLHLSLLEPLKGSFVCQVAIGVLLSGVTRLHRCPLGLALRCYRLKPGIPRLLLWGDSLNPGSERMALVGASLPLVRLRMRLGSYRLKPVNPSLMLGCLRTKPLLTSLILVLLSLPLVLPRLIPLLLVLCSSGI